MSCTEKISVLQKSPSVFLQTKEAQGHCLDMVMGTHVWPVLCWSGLVVFGTSLL